MEFFVLTTLFGAGALYCLALFLMAKERDRRVETLLTSYARDLDEVYARYNHPVVIDKNNVINVDFTEVEPSDIESALKYKLVYDEVLGIYYKTPR